MHRILKTEWDIDASGIILKHRSQKAVCAWSTKNLIAFTTGFVEAKTRELALSLYMVHILCPENPWEVYHLETGLSEPVQHLLWDRTGTQLLVVDVFGLCKIFEMDGSMINSWKCTRQIDLENHVVCLSLLNQESRYLYEPKVGHVNLLEKFPRKLIKPPLSDIAGLSKDGFIAITETGVAHVVLFEKGAEKCKVQKTKLFTNRSRVLLGDIHFKEDGKIQIVLATDQRVVEFFVLVLRMHNSKCEISFEISPCIVPHLISDEEYPTYKVTDARFINAGNMEYILVCTENETSTCMKYFELKIEKATLHSVLQRMVQNPKFLNVKEWSCQKSFTFPGKISCTAVSRMLIAGLDNAMFPSIMVSTEDNNLHKIATATFSEVSKVDASSEGNEEISCLVYSPCDTCVCAITVKGNMMLFLVTMFENVNDPSAIKTVGNLFHYCVTAGKSPWDVAVLCASMGDSFAEQCHFFVKKEIANQSVMIQERTFADYARVQACIYKGLRNAYYGTIESNDSILLKAIHCFLQFTISTTTSDKESQIMNKIRTICSRKFDIDLPRVLQLLEVKDVAFSASLVSSLQYMIHWVSTYSIRICKMILLADTQSNNKLILSTLSIQGLKSLRELLVLFYVWGQALPGWQPHFLEFGNPLETMSQIFRLVSKLCLKFMQGDYSKDNVNTDEVPMKSNPKMYQNLPLYDPKSGIISQSQYLVQDFDVYAFDTEVETIASAQRYKHSSPLMEQTEIYGVRLNECFYDGINLITTSLLKGETLKQCIECSCLTLSNVNPSRNLLTTWREQWLESCFCGGMWRDLSANKT